MWTRTLALDPKPSSYKETEAQEGEGPFMASTKSSGATAAKIILWVPCTYMTLTQQFLKISPNLGRL